VEGCGGVWCWYQLPSEDKILNHFFFGCNINTSGDAEQSVHLVAGEGLEAYLPLADMIDISAEVERLSKRLSKMQTEYDGLKARLSSPNVCTHLIVNALCFNMLLHKSLSDS
jgi:valyl-tRNA synthetase